MTDNSIFRQVANLKNSTGLKEKQIAGRSGPR